MITVTVEQTRKAATQRVRVSAASIERALEISGAGRPGIDVRVVFPIDAEAFFAPVRDEVIDYVSMTTEEIGAATEAGLPGAYDAWMGLLEDAPGEKAFEVHATEHAHV